MLKKHQMVKTNYHLCGANFDEDGVQSVNRGISNLVIQVLALFLLLRKSPKRGEFKTEYTHWKKSSWFFIQKSLVIPVKKLL